MTVVLGLLAALLYGIGDFVGGITSRRHSALTVLLLSYPVGALLMSAMLPFFPGTLDAHTALFGVLGGVAGMVGVILMYSLMTIAPINIISPVTAVLAAIVPVVVGVIIGERPKTLAWFGIALGLAAVVLVSRTNDTHPHGRMKPRVIVLAVLSGLGFGMYFVLLAQAGDGSGLWPLVISRIASAVLIVPVAYLRGAFSPIGAHTISGPTVALIVLAGACDALANLFFLLAARTGLLSLASVLTSLYPAITVVLARFVLSERVSGTQQAGVGLTLLGVVAISAG